MNKKVFVNTTIKLLTVLIVCLIFKSCKGQENKNSLNESHTKKSDTTGYELESSLLKIEDVEMSFIFSNSENKISDVVRTMLQDSKGNFWFGTQNGAFKYDGNALVHIDEIQSELGKNITIKDIAEGKDGSIWFGHTDGLSVIRNKNITNYYESDGLISNDVWCITTDKTNQVWIGTIKGVCKFDGVNFTNFELPEGKLDTSVGVSSTKMIHNIIEDSKGRIWFSTNGGIYLYDNDVLVNISEKDGLNTSFVNMVIETKKGDFWISTSKGLFQYKDDTLTNVTKKLFEEEKGTGSIIEDSKGAIWFNCARRILSLNDGEFTEHRLPEGSNGPLTFQIYEDHKERLWFVGFGGAFRYENGSFINVSKNGPF
jgi:ligand-binding sensor domain-containing protein